MSDTLRYEVVIEGNDRDGYSAFLPSLLGCVSAGDTIDEIKTLIVEAVSFHIEGMVEDGLPIPDPIPPELWEKEFGMSVPESVVPCLFVEISEVREVTADAHPNSKSAYKSRLVYDGPETNSGHLVRQSQLSKTK